MDLPPSTPRRVAGPEDVETCPRCDGLPYTKRDGLSRICGLCEGAGKVTPLVASGYLLTEDDNALDYTHAEAMAAAVRDVDGVVDVRIDTPTHLTVNFQPEPVGIEPDALATLPSLPTACGQAPSGAPDTPRQTPRQRGRHTGGRRGRKRGRGRG